MGATTKLILHIIQTWTAHDQARQEQHQTQLACRKNTVLLLDKRRLSLHARQLSCRCITTFYGKVAGAVACHSNEYIIVVRQNTSRYSTMCVSAAANDFYISHVQYCMGSYT